jgi:biotin carboxylase
MKKLAILGASYLQVPLIKKANDMGLETHVFAWEEGAVGKELASYFYPISILDKEAILMKCKEISIDGIITIGTDIAMPIVNYIANEFKLIGNSLEATLISTDKYEMRKALSSKNIPCPKFSFYEKDDFQNHEGFEFPLIVKPTDRSGSRGVTKVNTIDEANKAILKALDNSINKRVIVEEFIQSEREFSVEFISFKGKHYPIAITDKVTTREPYFVEMAHHQPANVNKEVADNIYKVTIDVLNALEIKNGASHTEVYLLDNGEIRVVESAGRMGGELIGSHMVQLSTGFDFLMATIDVSLNQFDINKYKSNPKKAYSGVYYIVADPGKVVSIKNNSINFSDIVYCESLCKVGDFIDSLVDGANKRSGIMVYSSDSVDPIKKPVEVLDISTINFSLMK